MWTARSHRRAADLLQEASATRGASGQAVCRQGDADHRCTWDGDGYQGPGDHGGRLVRMVAGSQCSWYGSWLVTGWFITLGTMKDMARHDFGCTFVWEHKKKNKRKEVSAVQPYHYLAKNGTLTPFHSCTEATGSQQIPCFDWQTWMFQNRTSFGKEFWCGGLDLYKHMRFTL